jgi:hypothetical protein
MSPSLSLFFFLSFLLSLALRLFKCFINRVCDYVNRARTSVAHTGEEEEEGGRPFSRGAWLRAPHEEEKRKRSRYTHTHTHTQREEKTRLSFSLSRFFVVLLSGDPSKFPLRFWRLDCVFVFVVVCVVVCVVSFRFDDDAEKRCFFALLRHHEEAQRRRRRRRGDDGGFEGRAETRGNDETIGAAGRRATTPTPSNWGKKHQ